MSARHSYDVFLSYNAPDRARVEQIARSLRAAGLKVFFDQWNLSPGEPWLPVLEQVLGDCRAVAVCIGRTDMGPWQQRESNFALERQARDPGFRVVPVLLPGADPALGFLGQNTWIDLGAGIDDPVRLERLAIAVSPDGRPTQQTLGGICPYRGLLYFREEDAAFFFGRDVVTAKLLAAVDKRNWVALVGASGSGKSSVVRAGLVPLLRRRNDPEYEVVTMVPGDRPLHRLAGALIPLLEQRNSEADRLSEQEKVADYLAGGVGRLREVVQAAKAKQRRASRFVLLVDQWEELYTQTRSEELRRCFIDELLDVSGSGGLCVVITLRADFLGRALAYRPMCDRLEDTQINLGLMTGAELQQAIEAPAHKTGLKLEAGLTKRILNAVGDEPGNLPLLEFVLKRLWEGRQGGELRHAVYDAMGELSGAVASKADDVYGRLSRTEQEAVRRLFLQLIRPGEGTEGTRRRAPLREIGSDTLHLVYKLADERLLVTGRGDGAVEETVEIAHESLIQNWDRLKTWLREDREFLLWRDWLRAQVALSLDPDRSQGDEILLRGALLLEAQRWLAQRPDQLQQDERHYIERSIRLRTRERRKRVGLVAAGTLVLVAAALTGLIAMMQKDRALAERRAYIASRLATAAERHVFSDPQLGNLLAAKSFMLSRGAEHTVVQGALRALNTVVQAATPRLVIGPQPDQLFDVSFSPDGHRFALAGADHVVTIWDTESGRLLASCKGHEAAVTGVAFSPDGLLLASASRDGTARIWDSRSAEEMSRLWRHGSDVFSVAFAPDGMHVATASKDRTAKLWRVDDGSETATLAGHTDKVYAVAYAPDGRSVATASIDATARIWDAKSGRSRAVLRGHTSDVLAVAYSPDSRRVATGGRDLRVRMWNAADGKQEQVLIGHDASVSSVAFAPGGSVLATGSHDRTVRLWNIATGRTLLTLSGHGDFVQGVAFSRDARRLVSASADGFARVWDVSQLRKLLVGQRGSITSVAYSPDSKRLATASADGTARVWDVEAGTALAALTAGRASVSDLAFSPDGRFIATASEDGIARIWDAASGTLKGQLRGHRAGITGVSYSADGKYLATSGKDGAVIVWDPVRHEALGSVQAHGGQMVLALAFAPHAPVLATASFDGSVRLWQVEQPPRALLMNTFELKGHRREVQSLAFSADGLTLASGSADRSIRLWDTRSGTMRAELNGHDDGVTGVAFNPDGHRLISTSADGATRLWDTSSGQALLTWSETDTGLHRVAYRADGKQVALARLDAVVRLLDEDDLTPKSAAQLLAIAQSKGSRTLNAADCARYAEVPEC